MNTNNIKSTLGIQLQNKQSKACNRASATICFKQSDCCNSFNEIDVVRRENEVNSICCDYAVVVLERKINICNTAECIA